MSERFAATYFDGVDGRAHAVELRRVGTAHYAIDGDGVVVGGAISTLRITPRLARVARTIELKGGARVFLAHDAAIDAWFPRQGRFEAVIDRLEHHAYVVGVAILICVATLATGAIWGVPRAADAIAMKIPPSVEQALGAEVLENLDRLGLKASTLDASRREALVERFDKLAADAGGHYMLAFRDAPGIGANAFAIPGGTVVVTDQLVRKLDDDREFDAVVAHEIGHQQRRHALRQTLRGSMVAIVAAFFAGDVSSAGTVVVAVPTFLLTSHYSREFEDEADHYAFDLLSRRGESPHWFAEAMHVLQSAHPNRGRSRVAYLSSHPDTGDRITAAEDAAIRFAAAHPDLCPKGVCPGEGLPERDRSVIDDDDDASPSNLSCNKD
ncbi:MAG TPA: M48 family metallopeptidase [Rhodanobacteraceae bacterium]|nr:M48 family metallopeptidase [Rhodanobacteraceae bacterium]